MFENDLLVAFVFMALLFLRQIYILKQPNKINYSPLMVGIGAIGSVVHFIIQPENANVLLTLRESLFPLLVGLLLYIVMNILHQTQESENSRSQEAFKKEMVAQVAQLKEFMHEFEGRVESYTQEDRAAQGEIREKFQKDVKALEVIQFNQSQFLDKFNEMESWHNEVANGFKNFTSVQLPELDKVVHRHLDTLRIEEAEHHKQIKSILSNAVASRGDMLDGIEALKESLNGMQALADSVAKTITKHTLQQLSGITNSFEKQVSTLKSQTESLSMELLEGENRLSKIKEQSELIVKQMVLSANSIKDIEKDKNELHKVYIKLEDMIREIGTIKSEYLSSKNQLSSIAKEIKLSEEEQIVALKNQVDTLSENLTQKIEESLEKLHSHYHIASEDITQSVQMLNKKAQFKKGYSVDS